MTTVTEVRNTSACLLARGTPWWVLLQHSYYVAIMFHRRVWYRVLSLCYACIQSSGIILIPRATFVPNFVSFAAWVSPCGEKSHTQSITHWMSLFDAPRTQALALWNNTWLLRLPLPALLQSSVRLVTTRANERKKEAWQVKAGKYY